MSMMVRITVVFILLGGAVWTQWIEIRSASKLEAPPSSFVEELYQAKKSDVVVEVLGSVSKLKDNSAPGIRRQEFTLEFPGGHQVEVSHDTTTSPRVPMSNGDQVEVRGEYIWTEKGGIIHMTHRDPIPERTSGWINHNGKTYE
ncbi:MAG: hypothetical protein ACI97A_003729 [Planctomycetota bacterium]|jgi:hypothetical protein